MSFLLASSNIVDFLNDLFIIGGAVVGTICLVLLVVSALQATIRSFKR